MERIRLTSQEREKIVAALKLRAGALADMKDFECCAFLLEHATTEFPAGWNFEKIQAFIIKLVSELRCGRTASAISMIEQSGLIPPKEKA